nr:MAK10-like protein [Tanacetum cinerariifolium]
MGDENPICTLGYYSKPSHKGYRNTIKLPVGNNVCEIDHASGDKLLNKNANKPWEIIENLALYDHEGWNDTNVFTKTIKAISTPQDTSKTPNRRLLELEDQIKLLLKGSRPMPMPNSTHAPQAYVEVVYSNSHPQNQPPKLNPFTFHKRISPNPQAQTLGTTFEAQVRDFIAAHTKRIERFENASFKQCEEINATRDDSKEIDEPDMEVSVKEAETKKGAKSGAKNKLIKKTKKEEVVEAPSSWRVEYYLKQRINEKLIKGLVDNNRFNYSMSGARVRKINGKTCNVLPMRPVYEAILKKKITKKEDTEGNF